MQLCVNESSNNKTWDFVIYALLAAFLLLVPWVKVEVFDRVIAAEFVFVALLIAVGVQWLQSKNAIPLRGSQLRFAIVVALWVVAALLSGVNAPDFMQYLFTAGGVIYLGFVGVTIGFLLTSSRRVFSDAIGWLVCSLAIVAIVSLIGMLKGAIGGNHDLFFFSNTNKLIGTFKYSNQLAGFLVLVFPLSWELCIEGQGIKRLPFVGMLLVIMGAILATASKAGLAAVLVIGGVYLLLYLLERKFKRVLVLATLGTIVLGLLFLLRSHVGVIARATDAIETVLVHGQFTDQFRLGNWSDALSFFLRFPIIGSGLGSFAAEYGLEVHNTYLSALAEMGLLGASSLLVLFGYMGYIAYRSIGLAKRYWPKWEPLARGLFMGLLAEYVFATQHVMYRSRHLWLVFGMVVAMNTLLRKAGTKKGEEDARNLRHTIA